MNRAAATTLDDADEMLLEAVPPAVGRFAALVRKERERRGWSQRNLAEATKLTHEIVRRIEAGQCNPRLDVVVQLALVLGFAGRPNVFARIAFGQIGANRVNKEPV